MRYELNVVCRGDDFDSRYDAVLRLMRYWAKIVLQRHLGQGLVVCLRERPNTIIRNMPDECPPHTVVLGALAEDEMVEGDGTLFTLTAEGKERPFVSPHNTSPVARRDEKTFEWRWQVAV